MPQRRELINPIGGHDGDAPKAALTSRSAVSVDLCLCRIEHCSRKFSPERSCASENNPEMGWMAPEMWLEFCAAQSPEN
jgi:hypothetical protein